jgi:hypothetical protein
MNNVISGILLIAGTYAGSALFAIVLFRIFFPLKTKAVQENKLTFSYTKDKTAKSSTKNKVHLLPMRDGESWVKVNS